MQYLHERPNWDRKKILLIRLDRLGDLIVSTPTMQAIKKTFPNSKLDLLASNMNCALLKYCDYLDYTYIYNKKKPLEALKLLFKLRKEKYDVIICLAPHSKSCNFFTKYISAPIKLAFFEPPTKFQNTYTYSAPKSTKNHLMEEYQDNAKKMGFESPGLKPIINVPTKTYEEINAKFPKNTEKMRITISVGNIKRPHKRWPAQKYAQVIQYLNEKYNQNEHKLEIYVMSGVSDLAIMEEFKEVPQNYFTLYVGKDIAQSAAFIENCDLFICTSSGPSHIAASTKCPILSIISPYMYKVWRPLRENDQHIVNKPIQNIEVAEVIQKIEDYIRAYFSRC